jgi:hypothetical protein
LKYLLIACTLSLAACGPPDTYAPPAPRKPDTALKLPNRDPDIPFRGAGREGVAFEATLYH